MPSVLSSKFICEVAADVIITGTIAWKLHSSKTGWDSTDRMIKRLLVCALLSLLFPERAPGSGTRSYPRAVKRCDADATAPLSRHRPLLPSCTWRPFPSAHVQTPACWQLTMGSSLVVLVLFYTHPNSTVLTSCAFSPKIGVLCILLTLLSRVHIVESHLSSDPSGPTRPLSRSHSNSRSRTQGQSRTAVVRSTNRLSTVFEGSGWQHLPGEGLAETQAKGGLAV